MAYNDRSEFLEAYYKLCQEHKCYIDGVYGKPLYVHEFQYPVDESFEKTMEKLYEDVG